MRRTPWGAMSTSTTTDRRSPVDRRASQGPSDRVRRGPNARTPVQAGGHRAHQPVRASTHLRAPSRRGENRHNRAEKAAGTAYPANALALTDLLERLIRLSEGRHMPNRSGWLPASIPTWRPCVQPHACWLGLPNTSPMVSCKTDRLSLKCSFAVGATEFEPVTSAL